MSLVLATVLLLLFAATLGATWLALFAWQRRVARWTSWLTAFLLAVAVWSLGQVLELDAGGVALKTFWALVQLPGILVAPIAWLLTAVHLTGQERRLTWPVRLLIVAPPAITALLAAALPVPALRTLLWREVAVSTGTIQSLSAQFGPWYVVHVTHSTLLLVAGALLLQPALQDRLARQPWWERGALLLAAWLPWPTFLLPRMARFELDIAPVAFTVSGGLLVWGLLRQKAWDLVPVAHQTVFDQMVDGVVVVNVQERIVDVNPAAERLLHVPAAELRGMLLEDALPGWQAIWERSRVEAVEEEVAVDTGNGGLRHFELRVSPLYRKSGAPRGRVVVWHDVTAQHAANEALLARQIMFEKLVAVARVTATGLSLEETLQNALDVASSVTGAEQGSIFLLDDELRIRASILARVEPHGEAELGRVMREGLAGWAVRSGETVLVADTAQEPRWITLSDQPYVVRSALVAPIIDGERTPGVLTLQHSQPDHFSAGDVELMRAATHQIALALHNAQIYEGQRELAAQQQTVYHVLATIGAKLDQGSVVDAAVETIQELTGWPALAILVPQGEMLLVHAATGIMAPVRGEQMPLTAGYSGGAFMTGKPRLVRDLEAEPGYYQLEGLRSLVAVPLHRQDRLGVFLVGSDRTDAFREEDLRLMELLAEALALALANARLFQVVSQEQTRLRSLIRASRDGIMLVGTDRRLLVVNPRALAYWGLPGEPEAWEGAPLARLYEAIREREPAAAAVVAEETERVVLGDPAAQEGDLRVNGRDLHWVNLPVEAEETMLGRLIVTQDVTRERELQQMREDVTHMMVHDLRNPLNVVASGLEMAQTSFDEGELPRVQELMKIAGASTKRMLALVNDILNISRLESGRLPLERTAVSLETVVKNVIDAQTTLAVAKGLRLTTRAEQPLPAAYVDAWLIERVLDNLLSNAIKFTPLGGEVHTALRLQGEEFVVSVRDSGPGLPEGLRDSIFEKFVTGDRRERGTGLGLAFCRLAVEAHGGRIWVDSVEGQGAQFTFTLPVAAEDEVEAADQAAT